MAPWTTPVPGEHLNLVAMDSATVINALTIDAFNYNIARMEVPVDVVTLGPASLDALRDCLRIVAGLLAKNVAVTDARPAVFEVGSQSYASYRVTIPMQVQTA